jgi:hypothetical protein
MGQRSFAVPPSLASLLALSRAISASRPILTRAVFYLIPVNSEALPRILSSMLIVVLICIMMPFLCISVNPLPS